MQLDRVGIEGKSLPEYIKRLVVLAFIVKLMRAFIVLLGTQEGVHWR
jgi:hypothetical protein